MLKHLNQIMTNTRLIPVDIAGGVDRDLPGRLSAVFHWQRLGGRMGFLKRLTRVLGEPRIFVDANDLLTDRAGCFIVGQCINGLNHNRDRGQFSICRGIR